MWGGAHSDLTEHHQKVQVENDEMAYGISFGPKEGTSLWGKIHVGNVSDGVIYDNTNAKWLEGQELGRMNLTKEEDKFVKGIMENMKDKSAPYGVIYGIDCRLFSENTLNALVEIIIKRRESCAE